jgi:hypothetical protein
MRIGFSKIITLKITVVKEAIRKIKKKPCGA